MKKTAAIIVTFATILVFSAGAAPSAVPSSQSLIRIDRAASAVLTADLTPKTKTEASPVKLAQFGFSIGIGFGGRGWGGYVSVPIGRGGGVSVGVGASPGYGYGYRGYDVFNDSDVGGTSVGKSANPEYWDWKGTDSD